MELITPWIVLIGLITALLLLDLFVLHKKERAISFNNSVIESAIFIFTALLFGLVVFQFFSENLVSNPNNLSPVQALTKYYTGYLVELSLSIDNLFVIAVIFTSYRVPVEHQHKLLFYGVLGALILRAVLIFFGLELIRSFHWMPIVFGAFLLYTSFKMLKQEAQHKELHEPTRLMKLARLTHEFNGSRFLLRKNGKVFFSALFSALITIEFTDLLFAVDSIPAVLSISTDPYIVYSSNIMAVLGMRSLYFFLSHMLGRFAMLKYSIFSILVFVSIKLISSQYIEIPEWFSLFFIAVSLGIGAIISVRKTA